MLIKQTRAATSDVELMQIVIVQRCFNFIVERIQVTIDTGCEINRINVALIMQMRFELELIASFSILNNLLRVKKMLLIITLEAITQSGRNSLTSY